jgi:hypothetical protein
MVANHQWIADCQAGNIKSFPYRLVEDGRAAIGRPFTPNVVVQSHVVSPDDSRPLFVVNIPMAYRVGSEGNLANLKNRLSILTKEAYGKTAAASTAEVKKQVAVVIGINQFESIDPSINRKFKSFIASIPHIAGVAHRIIGFFWKPVWAKVTKGSIYPLSKAYLLLKALSSASALAVQNKFEMPNGLHPRLVSQIPYQAIRETIKNSEQTRAMVKKAETLAPAAPIYFTVMDADFIALITSSNLFERLQAAILANDLPSVVSLGYQATPDSLPLIRLAIRMDMLVREALTSVFPYGSYFPEPCTGFLARKPYEGSFLHRLSFMGAGRGLENRRLIESGRSKELFDDNTVMIADGGVTTTIPSRMLTLKNQRFTELTVAQLKSKQCLQALRAISQTHATPKQWADNLYNGLDFTCPKVTDATTPMMHIFNVFDPISRMFRASRYSRAVFDSTLADYDKPLSEDLQNLLNTAKAQLYTLGMKKEMIDNIVEAAKRSGQAICDFLIEETA